MTSLMSRFSVYLFSIFISLSLALSGCSGSSEEESTPAAITISGKAATSTGTISQFRGNQPILLATLDFFISQSEAAVTGVTGVPNVTVELIRIDNSGALMGDVLASTTTDGDGNYTLTLPAGVEPSGNLVVQIHGSTETVRAIVSSSTKAININPVSQFILNTLINEDLVLTQLDVDEIQQLVDDVEALNIVVPATVTVADAVTGIENNTSVNNAIEEQVSAVANTSLISGAWQIGSSGPNNGEMLVFYPNNFYLNYSVDAQDCASGGVEYGTYSYDGRTLNVTATVDQNGQCGLVGSGGELPQYTATFSNKNQFDVTTPEDGTVSFTRVTDGNPDSIVGGWNVDGSSSDPLAIVFYANGNYSHYQTPDSDSNCAPGGIEYGTYLLDGTTLILNITEDENGDCGLGQGPGSVTFGSNQAAVITIEDNVFSSTGGADDVFSFDRLETSDGSTSNSSGGGDAGSLANSVPVAVISIDGNPSDWVNISTAVTDPAGDQNGNSSTDFTSLKVATSNDTFYLLMETTGNIAFPHTLSAEYSHYEVGLHFFTDSNCQDPVAEINYLIANNFTDLSGTTYHQLDNYISGERFETNFNFSGSFLETSFSTASFPDNANSMNFNPYIQSSGVPNYTQHDNANGSLCFLVP